MRLLAHQIADRLNVLDVDDVLELPMCKIMHWAQFYEIEAGKDGSEAGAPEPAPRARRNVRTTRDPMEMERMLEQRYGR